MTFVIATGKKIQLSSYNIADELVFFLRLHVWKRKLLTVRLTNNAIEYLIIFTRANCQQITLQNVYF